MKTRKTKRRVRRVVVGALTLVVLITSSLSGSDSTGHRSTLTFLPNPYEKTRYYTIYEFGLHTRVNNRFANNFTKNVMVTFSLGVMSNINQKSAAGLMFRGESDAFGGQRLALMPRYHLWLDNSRGLDISAGFFMTEWPSFTASISADIVKSLAVNLTLETLYYFGSSTFDSQTGNFTQPRLSETSLHMGLNAKSYAAVAASGAVVVLLAYTLATWDGIY